MQSLSRVLAAMTLLAALGCGGAPQSQTPNPEQEVTLHVVNQSMEPITLSAMYGVSPATRLGRVPSSGEATFTFFWRAGDLRIVLDYLENRKGTSNAIVDLRRGDVLELTIRGDGTPDLRRKR